MTSKPAARRAEDFSILLCGVVMPPRHQPILRIGLVIQIRVLAFLIRARNLVVAGFDAAEDHSQRAICSRTQTYSK
jgi:hypothetical protein